MKKFAFLLIFVLLFSSLLPLSAVSAYTPDFEPDCEAVILVNTDTGFVIYEKNADEKMYPASLTKIMTAILAIENVNDLETEKATAKSYIFDYLYGLGGSTAGIVVDESLSIKDLLGALLLPSGNEAAMMIADYIGGGDIQVFVDMMNAKAKELGMTGTHFSNPHGLHNDNHYTTARDLYLLTDYAMKNPIFAEYVSMTRYTLPKTEQYPKERMLVNTNSMIEPGSAYYYGSFGDKSIVTGVKTGHTNEAGKCFVGTASKDGVNLLSVCLGGNMSENSGNSNQAFTDTKKLYDWGFNKFDYKTIVDKDDRIKEIHVNMAQDTDSLILVPQKSIDAYIPSDVGEGSIKQIIEGVPESVDAPVDKGQQMGVLILKLADEEIGRVPLVASDSVEQSKLLLVTSKIKSAVTSPVFKAIIILLVLFILFYIYVFIKSNKKRKQLEYIGKRRRSKYVDDDAEYDNGHDSWDD